MKDQVISTLGDNRKMPGGERQSCEAISSSLVKAAFLSKSWNSNNIALLFIGR